MGTRVIKTKFCDLCEVETDDLVKTTVPVRHIYMDEYGRRARDMANNVETKDLELCSECLERVVLLEVNVGLVGPCVDEGRLRWVS